MVELKLEENEEVKLQRDFLECVKDVEKQFQGHETYGDFTEFYDEDGVVLLTISEKEENQDALLFYFTTNDQSYLLKNSEIKRA